MLSVCPFPIILHKPDILMYCISLSHHTAYPRRTDPLHSSCHLSTSGTVSVYEINRSRNGVLKMIKFTLGDCLVYCLPEGRNSHTLHISIYIHFFDLTDFYFHFSINEFGILGFRTSLMAICEKVCTSVKFCFYLQQCC